MRRDGRWAGGWQLLVVVLGAWGLAGCASGGSDPGPFAMDFARQFLAAWIL